MMRFLILRAAIGVAVVAIAALDPVAAGESFDDVLRRIDANTRALDRLRQRTSAADALPARAAIRVATSRNFFVVTSSDDEFAARVLSRAESARRALARSWLGEELPEGRPYVLLHADRGDANTGRATQALHADDVARIRIVARDEETLLSTLEHELTHVVLRARFPHGIPAWANEGAASLSDDPERQRIRRDLLTGWAKSGDWPPLEGLLTQDTIAPHDRAAYAAAASLVECLIERGGRSALLRCVEIGTSDGWDAAFDQVYRLCDVPALERAWRGWAMRREASTPLQTAHPSGAEGSRAGDARLAHPRPRRWTIADERTGARP